VLEAAVYGKPVVFGPVYDKFVEAEELLEEGGAFTVATALEAEDMLNRLLTDKELYMKSSKASKAYVYAKTGATVKIVEYIYKHGFFAGQAKRL
jgi:3-deoxy-D-manno-octulosonic-acid transferase